MGTKRSRLVWVVLAGSVALNLFLLVSLGKAGRPSTVPQQPSPVTPRADCCRGLAHCQRQRWTMALGALQGQQVPLPDGNTAAPLQKTPRAPTTLPAVGPAEQQAALCTVATEQLRRDWTAKGEELTKSLRKSLANAADQEKGMQREVQRFADALNLTPADRDRLETHYRPLREKRIAEALTSLEKAPPDWNTVHQTARALFVDQDRLTQELFGSPAVNLLRQSQLKSRTVLLALAAAQAGLDWNRSITW